MFDELDRVSGSTQDEPILKAPFGYPGGKSRSVKNILPHLPYANTYVEPFGGSAAVLLARKACRLEVLNDRYAGVTDFYRCLRDPDLMAQLVEWLELTVHSKEEFAYCHKTWKDANDIVERAARWYYITSYSFGGLGRNWGRITGPRNQIAGRIQKKLSLFPDLHRRLQSVQVENQDWEQCLRDYDSSQTVFYCDPPYVDVNRGTYKHEMSIERHREFLDLIFQLDGFVAVSGYPNPLYDDRDWDDRITWEAFVSIQSVKNSEANFKAGNTAARSYNEEVLWLKKFS